MTYEELVEKVARDIYNWKPRNKPFELLPVEFQRQYTKRSRVILATIREALSEPTLAMYAAVSLGRMDEFLSALAASPLVEDERKTVSNENSGENDRCPY